MSAASEAPPDGALRAARGNMRVVGLGAGGGGFAAPGLRAPIFRGSTRYALAGS